MPGLPLSCWGMDSLSRIGSVQGTPLYADSAITCQSRISFARMLIEIDVTQPVQRNVVVAEPSGRQFNQQIVYEWDPAYCHSCNQ